MSRVGAGNCRGIEIGAQHPFAWARFLDFGNHGWMAGRNFRMQRTDEVAWLPRFLGVAAQHGERAFLLCRSYFLALYRKDFFKNVRHKSLTAEVAKDAEEYLKGY